MLSKQSIKIVPILVKHVSKCTAHNDFNNPIHHITLPEDSCTSLELILNDTKWNVPLHEVAGALSAGVSLAKQSGRKPSIR